MKEKDKYSTLRSEFLSYIRGEMNDRERNAFERKLQKDEFKEEALEGFSEFPADQTADDLSVLDKRLKARISGRNTIIIYRIAASFAILLVLSALFIILNRKVTTELPGEIAYRSETFEISKSKALKEPEMPAAPSGQRENAIMEEAAAERSAETVAQMNAERATLPDSLVNAAGTEKSERLIATAAESKPAEIIPSLQQAAISTQGAGAVAGVASKTDEANMAMKRKTTDEDLMLSTLGEVVTIGYGASAKAEREPAGYSPPSPVIGKSEFEKYISENIRKPATLREGDREVVVLSMIVRSSGVIDSLKIVRSPGDEFSEEALRLIREGPSWNPAEDNGVKTDEETRIRIIFK